MRYQYKMESTFYVFVLRLLSLGVILSVLSGCFSASSEDLTEVERACNEVSLETLTANNGQGITEDCKAAIERILDDEFYTEYGTLVTQIQGEQLILWGTDMDGGPVEPSMLSVTVNGQSLDEAQYRWTELADEDFDFNISYVIDYSGSMHDRDLEDAAEITKAINEFVGDNSLSNVVTFSTTANLAQEGGDKTATDALLAPDLTIEREGTALYDAMELALNLHDKQNGVINLLVVVTDGYENSSESATLDSVITQLDNSNTWVFALGALFSDQNRLEDITESRGYFVKSSALLTLQERLLNVSEQLTNLYQLQLLDDTDILAVEVSLANQ